MAAFGLVGIFVGSVTLAVSYTLLEAWVQDDPSAVASTDGTFAPTPSASGKKLSDA